MPSEPAQSEAKGRGAAFSPALTEWSERQGVPVDGREAKGHDETVKRYQVPIESCEVTCHDEIVSVKSKKQGASASADSANDAVPGDETVRVPLHFINGT